MPTLSHRGPPVKELGLCLAAADFATLHSSRKAPRTMMTTPPPRLWVALLLLAACRFDSSGIAGDPPDATSEDPADPSPAPDVGTGKDGDVVVARKVVLNTYSAIVAPAAAGARSLQVDEAEGFGPGDLVLVHLAAGVEASSGDQQDLDLDAPGIGRF